MLFYCVIIKLRGFIKLRSYTRPSVRPFVRSFVRPSVRPSICPSVRLFVHPSYHSSVFSSIFYRSKISIYLITHPYDIVFVPFQVVPMTGICDRMSLIIDENVNCSLSVKVLIMSSSIVHHFRLSSFVF